jgi:hypothetical protein
MGLICSSSGPYPCNCGLFHDSLLTVAGDTLVLTLNHSQDGCCVTFDPGCCVTPDPMKVCCMIMESLDVTDVLLTGRICASASATGAGDW